MLPFLGRRVLSTCSETVFGQALRGGLNNEELLRLEGDAMLRGIGSCSGAHGDLQPGGLILCLVPSEAMKELSSSGLVASRTALACVACVLSPAGLTVWAPKEEVQGMLELLVAD